MGKRNIPVSENALACTDNSVSEVWDEGQKPVVREQGFSSVCNKDQIGRFTDEIIAAAKDDRMNTKRVVEADIYATKQIVNQSGRVVAICEQELQRKDLPEERRKEILDCMNKAATSSNQAAAKSRQFQKEQLNRSHKLPWILLIAGILIFFNGNGRAVLLRTA